VRAIDVNGADIWTWSLGASARFAAALGASGGPLVLTARSTVYRLNLSDGTLISSLTPPAPARTVQELAPPIIDPSSTVYVIGNAIDSDSFQPLTQATVFAIDFRDQILWTVAFPRAMGASGAGLAVGPGRRLYLTVHGKLQAIGP
jgi:outer membrane protein assembly factor BamB